MGEEYIRNSNILSSLPHLGPLIYLNDFSNGLQMDVNGVEEDYIVNVTNCYSLIGGYSAYMRTNYTNAAVADLVQLRKKLPLPASPYIALDSTFMFPGSGGLSGLLFDLEFQNGNETIYACLRHAYADKVWGIEISDGLFSNIATPECPLTPYAWHHIHIEMDFANKTFLKLVSDNQIIKTFDFGMWSVTEATNSFIQLNITIEASGAQRPQIYVDNIMLSSIRA